MDDENEALVLRSVYLPLNLDRRVREIAFSRGWSNSELIRAFVREGLERFAASGEKTLAERVAAQVQIKKD